MGGASSSTAKPVAAVAWRPPGRSRRANSAAVPPPCTSHARLIGRAGRCSRPSPPTRRPSASGHRNRRPEPARGRRDCRRRISRFQRRSGCGPGRRRRRGERGHPRDLGRGDAVIEGRAITRADPPWTYRATVGVSAVPAVRVGDGGRWNVESGRIRHEVGLVPFWLPSGCPAGFAGDQLGGKTHAGRANHDLFL